MKFVKVLGRGIFSKKTRRLIEDTIATIEVLENSVAFHEPVEADFGVFNTVSSVLLGSKVSAGVFGRGSKYYSSGWLFNTSKKFTVKRKIEERELPLEPHEYRVEVDVPGSGLIEIPGYRFKNGVLLLYITPIYVFDFPGDTLSVGNVEDYAQVSIKPVKTGFQGELSLNLTKYDYVSLDIVGKLVVDQMFFGSEPGTVRYGFIPEPTLIISHEKTLNVPRLQKALGIVSMVSGHGDFSLRMRVGKFRREMKFSVELSTGGLRAQG